MLRFCTVALSCRKWLSYKNQPNDLLYKFMDWFLYYRDLNHERVKWCDFKFNR